MNVKVLHHHSHLSIQYMTPEEIKMMILWIIMWPGLRKGPTLHNGQFFSIAHNFKAIIATGLNQVWLVFNHCTRVAINFVSCRFGHGNRKRHSGAVVSKFLQQKADVKYWPISYQVLTWAWPPVTSCRSGSWLANAPHPLFEQCHKSSHYEPERYDIKMQVTTPHNLVHR